MAKSDPLPFTADSALFAGIQGLWRDVVHEELSYAQACAYGLKLLILVAAVARAKEAGKIMSILSQRHSRLR